MYSGVAFYAFSGTREAIPNDIASGDIQFWNLTKMSYEDFKKRLLNVMGLKQIYDKQFSEKNYDKCTWGLLIPFEHASNSSLVLVNLFSTNYLHPYFYCDYGLLHNMAYDLPRHWLGQEHTQNPLSFSSQNKLGSFKKFYETLKPTSFLLTAYYDNIYGIQKKRIHKAIEIFDRMGKTYTSIDNDHEAFYLDFTRLLECLLIDDAYDARGFWTEKFVKIRCLFLTQHFDFINCLGRTSIQKTLTRIYSYRDKFAHGKTYLQLNVMSVKNQSSGATGRNAGKHFQLRDDARVLLRSVLISYLKLFLVKNTQSQLRRMTLIELLSRVAGISWVKKPQKNKNKIMPIERPLKKLLLKTS